MCRVLLIAALAVGVVVAPVSATPTAAPASSTAREAPRFDGSSVEAFIASRDAFEADMGDAARLAFRMRLAEVRNKLAEQRGRHLDDAEFAAALDGKTLAELDAMADAAPTRIQIDIETSDDT
jgi:hypothetical protein